MARFLQPSVQVARCNRSRANQWTILVETRGVTDMSEEQLKKIKLVAYWLFSTTVIVFAGITAYIALWTRPVGASMITIVKAGLPIWGVTAVAAAIFFSGYYIYSRRQA
jgi:hypothetical protein